MIFYYYLIESKCVFDLLKFLFEKNRNKVSKVNTYCRPIKYLPLIHYSQPKQSLFIHLGFLKMKNINVVIPVCKGQKFLIDCMRKGEAACHDPNKSDPNTTL